MEESDKSTKATSPTSVMSWALTDDMEMDAPKAKREKLSAQKEDQKFPTKLKVGTLIVGERDKRQQTEDVLKENKGVCTGLTSEISTVPCKARKNLKVENLTERLKEATDKLREETKMKMIAVNNSALDKSRFKLVEKKLQKVQKKLQQEQSLRREQEQEVRMLRSESLSLNSTVPPAVNQPQPQNVAPERQKELDDVKHQLNEGISKVLKLLEWQKAENETLMQEMELMKGMHALALKDALAKQEDLERKLEVKNSTCLNMASMTETLDRTNHALEKKVEDIRLNMLEMMVKAFHMIQSTEAITDTNAPEKVREHAVEVQKPAQEAQKQPAQEANEPTEEALEPIKKPSLLKQFKKCVTPKRRCKFN